MGLSVRLHERRVGCRKELVLSPYRVLAFDTLGSTNDEAMARLKAGEPGGFIVTARSQSGGRGRQGRAWASPPGNLYASLALLDPAPLPLAAQLGFVAGVALAETLRVRLGGDDRLKIKWPNDMVHDGAKLAGILLESSKLRDGRLACVVGFGVNCASHPDGLSYPATDLREAGDPAADPAAVVEVLAGAMARRLALWSAGAGFPAIRVAWLDLAAGLGERIKVATPRGTLVGTFLGLDEGGRLLVETGTGTAVVDAGDVFLPGVATGAMEPRKDTSAATHEKKRHDA